ncbi:MAG: YncE family protein [Thermoanaerobaculia bacterium]
MTRVFALALREIVERKLLFLGAALVAVITLLVPLMPLPGRYAYGEVVDTSAFVFAFLLVVGGGVVLGATTIGRDLSSGRIAFFFTRQLDAWEIWAGRVLGMFLTLVLATFLVLLPGTLIGGGMRHLWSGRGNQELPTAAIFAILLPLAAHYTSVALRSRSAWLALDVVALCIASGMLWTLSLPFLPFWFGRPQSLGALFALLTACLAIAGWAGLAKGRIAPVAVHRWSAFTLWSLVAVALLSFAAWRTWVFAVSPHEIDLSKGWAHEIDGNGEWIGIGSGEKKGRGGIPHEFLMSTKTGAWMRVDDSQTVAVSADRRVAVIAKRSWNWRPPRWIDTTMQIVDLTAPKPTARELGIVLPVMIWSSPTLSADGSRLAIVESKRLSVYSLPEEKLLAVFPLDPEHRWSQVRLLDADTVRVLTNTENGAVVSTFDIASRKRISEHVFSGGRPRMDRAAEHVAISSSKAGKDGVLAVHDVSEGALLAEISTPVSAMGRRFHWLADGGFALALVPDDGRRRRTETDVVGESEVVVYALDGTERLRVPLPGARRIMLAGEQRKGELLLVWSESENFLQPCERRPHVVALDMASGSMRELAFEGWPKAISWGVSPEPGAASTRLFSACDGSLVMLDAATGATRELLGSR